MDVPFLNNLVKAFLFVLFIASSKICIGQTIQAQALELQRLSKESAERYQEQTRRVKEYSEKNNVPISYRDGNGNLVLMVDVSETGIPMYISSHNAGAALTTGVDKLRSGGSLGLNLEGIGMIVGVWDEGYVDHTEYTGRILTQQGTPSVHSNHVTGTILATGVNADAKGMAPKATAYTYDFANDETEMLTLAKPDQTSLLVSNHSYGLVCGWNFNGSSWEWFGGTVSSNEDYKFGYYSPNAAEWDQIAFNAPYYSIVKSAGNDRNNTGAAGHPPDCNQGEGYDCIGDVSTAKNIITVGAVSKVLSYVDPSSVQMSTFSSWGPTDDGRIKPDLVAAGVSLFSTSTGNN